MAKRPVDYALLVVTVILVLFGVIMVFSASYYYAENNPYTGYDAFYYFWTQLSGAAIGVIVMICATFFDYMRYKKLRFIILGVGLLLMVLVFLPGIGIERNGSRRWVNLIVIDIQSIEVLKFSIIVFMAGSIANNQHKMRTFKYGMAPYMLLLVVSAVLLYLQPNFSAVVTLAMLMFVMMLVGGSSLWHFVIMGALGIGGGALAMVSTKYRLDRIFAYTDPWKYASKEGYQLIQALYSIGSGGFFGLG
ncbi:MAG: FtsW/RodA/SpoVE family cell cycle protein, partial [Christensenellales bacterium]